MDILVVDDDFGSRVGMAQTLKEFHPQANVHQAASLKRAVAVLSDVPEMRLVLLDLNLEDSRGIATLRTLKQWCESNDCNPRIVIVSGAADLDESLIPEALEHCATGFIAKSTSVEVFRLAIDLTLAGSLYIPECYLRSRHKGAPASAEDPTFTTRERQVAALLIQGLTYKQIARRLSGPDKPMSDHTVRVHVQRMAWKLRLTDAGESDGLAAKGAVLAAFADQRMRLALAD